MKPSEKIIRKLGEMAVIEGNDYYRNQTLALAVAEESKRILNAVIDVLDEMGEEIADLKKQLG